MSTEDARGLAEEALLAKGESPGFLRWWWEVG